MEPSWALMGEKKRETEKVLLEPLILLELCVKINVVFSNHYN